MRHSFRPWLEPFFYEEEEFEPSQPTSIARRQTANVVEYLEPGANLTEEEEFKTEALRCHPVVGCC